MQKIKYRCVFLGYLWRIIRVIADSDAVELVSAGIEPQRSASSEAVHFCEKQGIPWFDARNIRLNMRFKRMIDDGIDLIVVGAFGQILNAAILKALRFGALNIHPSLLPAYRGGSPIEEQILAGERRGGVTLHWLTEEVDAGPIVVKREINIDSSDDYSVVLIRAMDAAEKLLQELLKKPIESWPKIENSASLPVRPPRSSKDGVIDWRQSAESIRRLILAEGWRGWVRAGLDNRELIIFEATAEDFQSSKEVLPGTVLQVTPYPVISTGKGILRLLRWRSSAKIESGQVLSSGLSCIG